ncbi:MAG: insulinase family protein [Alphaproteobacteria bacterium]|nr:insulinase family protein [Alphaproteobacteria bacterium]
MSKVFCLIVGLSLACFPACAKVFGAEEFYLDNGLRVVVVENHRAPIVKTMLFYKVGAMDEMAGKSGLAHLLEHLMFRGTTSVPASQFNTLMLENGVDFNAFTSKDFTAYHALSDISRLELVLFLEADRMHNLQIDDAAFSGEQKVVYQERQQRVENNVKSRFAENASQILWQNTPYGHPVSGTLEEINALTKEDALSFYRSFYAPNNAVLAIAGDITFDEAKKVVQKYFGAIKKSTKPIVHKNFPKIEAGIYQISKEMEDVQTPKITVSYIIPSITTDKKAAFALSVFASYFGSGGNSYMKRTLIKKHKVVSGAASADIFARGYGSFTASITPNPQTKDEDNLTMLENSVLEALAALDEDLLALEKKKMLSWLVYTKDNPENAAYLVGHMAALGLNLKEIEAYEQNIDSVTLEDIKKAVAEMQKAKKLLTVLMPRKEAGDEF